MSKPDCCTHFCHGRVVMGTGQPSTSLRCVRHSICEWIRWIPIRKGQRDSDREWRFVRFVVVDIFVLCYGRMRICCTQNDMTKLMLAIPICRHKYSELENNDKWDRQTEREGQREQRTWRWWPSPKSIENRIQLIWIQIVAFADRMRLFMDNVRRVQCAPYGVRIYLSRRVVLREIFFFTSFHWNHWFVEVARVLCWTGFKDNYPFWNQITMRHTFFLLICLCHSVSISLYPFCEWCRWELSYGISINIISTESHPIRLSVVCCTIKKNWMHSTHHHKRLMWLNGIESDGT